MKKIIMILAILLVSLLLFGCTEVENNDGNTSENREKINVIVSILPQKAFVEAVGGENVIVNELIPKGASPATYEPKPSDLVLVEEAEIYFRIGHIPFEKSQVEKFSGLNPEMQIVDTSKNVNLRNFANHEAHSHDHEDEHDDHEHDEEMHADDHDEEGAHDDHDHNEEMHTDEEQHDEEGAHDDHEDEHNDHDHADEKMHADDHDDHDHSGVDPHIWLSPVQVKAQVDVIAETLSEKDPANAETYRTNAAGFKMKLDELHDEIQAEFENINTNKLMVFHPAWGYFADEYGLKQIPIEQSGKEPTAEELAELIDLARDENIKVIFVQSQFNQEIANSIAEEIGAVVVSIDPLSEDYINNLKNVATTIADNLS